jgi:hypothetical protein
MWHLSGVRPHSYKSISNVLQQGMTISGMSALPFANTQVTQDRPVVSGHRDWKSQQEPESSTTRVHPGAESHFLDIIYCGRWRLFDIVKTIMTSIDFLCVTLIFSVKLALCSSERNKIIIQNNLLKNEHYTPFSPSKWY